MNRFLRHPVAIIGQRLRRRRLAGREKKVRRGSIIIPTTGERIENMGVFFYINWAG
jgi:hypothetical protein